MTQSMMQTLRLEIDGPVATLTMNRPDKRNAMNDQLLSELDAFFTNPPEGVKVVILTGTEGHYCSGLDLSEHVARDAALPGSLNMNRLLNSYRYDLLLEFRRQQLRRRESAMLEVVEAKRELVIEADREARVLEKLLEQEEQKLQRLEQRREQLLLDEIGHYRVA